MTSTTHSKDDHRTGCRNIKHCQQKLYVQPDDQTQPTFEMTPGFKPFTGSNMHLVRGSKKYSNKTLWSVHFSIVVVELIHCKCGGIVRNELW